MNRRLRKKKPAEPVWQQWLTRCKNTDWRSVLTRADGYRQRLPKLHQRVIAALAVVVAVLLILPAPQPVQQVDDVQEEGGRKTVALNTTGLSEQQNERVVVPPKTDAWKEYTVQAGDTLAQVFRSNGLPMADLNALARIEGSDKPLSRIKQGQLVRYKLNEAGELDILQLEKKDGAVMFFRLSDGGFGRSK